MKRKFIFILSLCFVLCLCASTSLACNSSQKHEHLYNKKIISDEFFASYATCGVREKYYYSCKCGAKSNLTFEYGDFLPHNYNTYQSNENGTHTKICANNSYHKVTVNCSGGTATCTKKATCIYCFSEYGDFSHSLNNEGFCSTCNHQISSTNGLVFQIANFGNYAKVTDYTGNDTNVVIPSIYQGYPVKQISDNAFSSCRSITSVKIPNGVTTIGSKAFYECSSLKRITLPSTITDIGDEAFYYCWSKKEVHYTGTIEQWIKINFDSLFSTPLYSGGHLYVNNNELVTNIFFSNITSINDYAFYDCLSVTSVVLPNTLTSLGYCAFNGCTSLESINIPKNLTYIEPFTFSGCNSLENISVDSTNSTYHSNGNCIIKTSTNELVVGCKNSIIPNYVTTIGSYAFRNLDSLTSIIIPESVTTIKNSAFDSCSSLSSINIGKNVSLIDSPFVGCSAIETITVAKDNNKYHSNENCLIETSTNTLIVGCKNSKIPNYITKIGEEAFSNCYNLESIVIPNSVKIIGYSAFSGCLSLKNINIPNSVTSIEGWAFYACHSISSILIPNSVTTVGENAFSAWDSNQIIYCETDTKPYGWNSNWHSIHFDAQVVWGYNGEIN